MDKSVIIQITNKLVAVIIIGLWGTGLLSIVIGYMLEKIYQRKFFKKAKELLEIEVSVNQCTLLFRSIYEEYRLKSRIIFMERKFVFLCEKLFNKLSYQKETNDKYISKLSEVFKKLQIEVTDIKYNKGNIIILGSLSNHLNYKDFSSKIIISVYSSTFIVFNILFYFKNSVIDVTQLVVQYLMVIISYITVYESPKMLKRLDDTKNAFSENAYVTEYKEHIKRLNIFCDNHMILKVIYIFSWLLIIWYNIICLYLLGLVSYDFLGLTTIVSYLVAIIPNIGSYYFCFLYVYFLRKVSNLKQIETLSHNIYIPSTSKGFKILLVNAQHIATTFLGVSSLYSLALCILITNAQIKKSNLFYSHPYSLLFMIFMILIMGIGTFIILYVGPKIFLGRILGKWKEHTLCDLEKKINFFESQKNYEAVKTMVDYVKDVDSDKLKYRYEILDMILIVTNILSNSVSILNFILFKYFAN